MYILNYMINELEDQKKVFIDQLKSMGVQSRAHYVYGRNSVENKLGGDYVEDAG